MSGVITVAVANIRRSLMPVESVFSGWSMYSSSSEKSITSSISTAAPLPAIPSWAK